MLQEAQPSRRLPVYILADCSGSMSGEPITAVSQGLQLLKDDLGQEPRAVESVWISVITFGSQAAIESPLTELMRFQVPSLRAEGSTPLGGALRLLNESIDRDVVRHSGEAHTGDYKPLVFLLTDGEPTDDWRQAAQAVKQRSDARTANIIAVGCGPAVNTEVLKEITETVLRMDEMSAGGFQKLLAWMSQSVKVASKQRPAVGQGTASGAVDLPPVPAGLQIVM
jgi:uncharacterized protein YegL